MNDYEQLLPEFIASFEKLDEMVIFDETDTALSGLLTGEVDEYGRKIWRPLKQETPRESLSEIYEQLPARFPKMYERLVLSYRWAEVEIGPCKLLANPPGPDLTGLLPRIQRNPALWEALVPAGYLQFAKGPDIDYDAVCFDLKSRNKNGNYRIVKIDHEEILCKYRVKVVDEIAPSLEELMRETIRLAKEGSEK